MTVLLECFTALCVICMQELASTLHLKLGDAIARNKIIKTIDPFDT